MKGIKKYSFFIIIIGMGLYYMHFVDNWQMYAKAAETIKDSCASLEQFWRKGEDGGDALPEASHNKQEDSQKGETVSGNGEAAGNEGTAEGGSVSGNGAEGLELGGTSGQEPENLPSQTVTSRSPEEVEYMTVDDSYFADAVFIGDSRIMGMMEYGGLEESSTFYASTGMTIYKLLNAPIVSVPGQKEKQTIEQALAERQFAKIYLMVGINEMGTGTVETFAQAYKEAVERIRQLQPEAIIYIQSIMRVTAERSNQGDYITNEGIDARNGELEKLADYVNVYYLDVNPAVCDESGGMAPSYTFDGVHLLGKYVLLWKDYLKSHAVNTEQILLDG